jgi:hypothetical protein
MKQNGDELQRVITSILIGYEIDMQAGGQNFENL